MPPWIPPEKFVRVTMRPPRFSNASLCSDPCIRTAANPEPISKPLVAGKLNIAERTVKFHVSNLLNKFGVRRRADLILLTFQRRMAPEA